MITVALLTTDNGSFGFYISSSGGRVVVYTLTMCRVCLYVCVYLLCMEQLRRVFGPKRDEVTGEWRKLRNEELNDLYSLPNIVRVVKSRRMSWQGMWRVWGRIEGCTGCW